jgi:hypothetical protein
MSNMSVASAATSAIAAPSAAKPATVSALGTATVLVDTARVWSGLLKTIVFPHVTIGNGKVRVNAQRRLDGEKARYLLALIWKDSPTVSNADLDEAGLDRTGTIEAPINCHNLAKDFAEGDVEDLDRQEKQIKTIVLAAEAYGLVVREQCAGKRQRPLRGTAKLHELMLAMDASMRPIFSDLDTSGSGGL